MTFEEAYGKLEEIKSKLENPETSFDDALLLYSESAKLTKQCLEILKSSEGKITAIKQEIDGIVEKPLDKNED